MTEQRRRRERPGRWFPGADPMGHQGPDGAETTGLPGLSPGSPAGSPTALPVTTPPDGLRGASGGVDIAGPRGSSSGLPGISARPGSIDGLPPFVENGSFDSYDPYQSPPEALPAPSTGQDWAGAPTRGGQAPARDRDLDRDRDRDRDREPERASSPASGLEVGPPTPAPLTGDLAEQISTLARRVDELVRLRRHDVELVDKLHEDNGKLRQGELTEAMGPLLRGLIRLHDQMSSLGGDDPQSVAGILRQQLLQVLDISADVRPYIAVPGSAFDPTRHLALRGIGTDDPARDRTIARGVRPGFVRGTSTVLRPAEAEVYRHR